MNVNTHLPSHDNFNILGNFNMGLEITALKDVCKLYGLTTISDKNYGKNCYLDNFLFLTPSPPSFVEKQ